MTEPTPASAPSGARVPRGRAVKGAGIRRWQGRDMAGITPDRVLSIVKLARRGELEQLFDLFAYIIETDSHVRNVCETLIHNVTGAKLRFDEAKVEDDELAAATVEFQRASVDALPRYEPAMMHLAMAHLVGVTVCEKEYGRIKGTRRVIAMRPVMPRDVKFSDDWVPMVRTYASGSGEWLRCDKEPARWIIHAPGAMGLRPQMAGLLIPCLLPWVFKKFATIYSQQTLERFATPLIVATLDERATEEVLDQVVDDLENITASSAGAIRSGGGKIEVINSNAGQAGQAHKTYIELFEQQITKAILGSSLNTDGGGGTGSYALGVSQSETTILPRVRLIADSLAETLREQWFAHELALNAHVFNGTVPEPALPFFELTQEEPPEVDQLTVDAGAVTVNELRQSRGLEPWDGERGERIVTPIAKSSPGFSRFEQGDSPEGAPPPKSMSRWQRRTPKPHKTSLMRSASMTQIANVPVD